MAEEREDNRTLPPAPPLWTKEWTEDDDVRKRIESVICTAICQTQESSAYHDPEFVRVAWALLMNSGDWVENLIHLAHEGFRQITEAMCAEPEPKPKEPVQVDFDCFREIKAALDSFAKRQSAEKSPEPHADG